MGPSVLCCNGFVGIDHEDDLVVLLAELENVGFYVLEELLAGIGALLGLAKVAPLLVEGRIMAQSGWAGLADSISAEYSD